MNSTEVIAHRIHVQQLDRAPADRPVTDATVFDLGVQDTGRDGASWALVNRGVPLATRAELEDSPEVALAWTLRGAPHYYRRSDLRDIGVATSPMSEADAGKRIFDASRPMREAGLAVRDGLAEVATEMRALVDHPMVKGDVSGALTDRLGEVHIRFCVPCQARHPWEMPFRLSALYAGLELEPGTSPPVLRRIPDWPRRAPGPFDDPFAAPEHLQPVRAALRLTGPATPAEIATFLDAPLADVKRHWPDDAVEVDRDGDRAWLLGEWQHAPQAGLVRLLGSFDLLLQGRDRALLVPDRAHQKALWPTIGRPGAVLVGTEIVGLWRPKAAGKSFTLRLDLWRTPSKTARARIDEQAELLAAHRGVNLKAIVED